MKAEKADGSCFAGIERAQNAIIIDCQERSHTVTAKTVGLDLAKDAFQVHCVSATGRKIINKKIKRAKLTAFCESRCG